MKQRRFDRFRRTAVAAVGGIAAFTGFGALAVVQTAQSASAASPAVLTANSAPTIHAGVANQAVGSWTLTIPPGATGGTVTICVTDQGGKNTVGFDTLPSVSAPSTAGNAGFTITSGSAALADCNGAAAGKNALTFAYTDTAATTVNQTINITGVSYDVLTANAPDQTAADLSGGPVVVSGTDTDAGLSSPVITPPNSTDKAGAAYDTNASNAIIATVAAEELIADSTPVIGVGKTSTAGTWELFLSGSGNSWASGDTVNIYVARNNGLNCQTLAKPQSIGFSGTPTVSVKVATNGATTTPTLTASLASAGSCSAASGVNNELQLKFTNSGSITGSGGPGFGSPIDVTISGLSYVVSSDTSPAGIMGNVFISQYYNATPTFGTTTVANDTLPCNDPDGNVPGTSVVPNGAAGNANPSACDGGSNVGGPSNASIGVTSVAVVANNPATTLQFNETANGGEVVGQSISNITITEGSPGALGGGVAGWACIALSPGAPPGFVAAEWTKTPTVTASGGGMTVANTTLLTPGGQTGPTELAFQVTTPSSSSAGTVTVSNIQVNVPTNKFFGAFSFAGLAFAANSAADACNVANGGGAPSGTPYAGNPFQVFDIFGRIYGQTADDTAAQEFSFDANGGLGCTTSAGSTPGTNAVLVTDQNYPDALSSSYLAGKLVNAQTGSVGTGILTTPTSTLSSAALNALRQFGVSDVYVVGGPLAVSQNDVTQLQNTPVYNCDGSEHRNALTGAVQNLTVHWIYGQTADATAEAVGTYLGPSAVGATDYPGAYGSTQYNDTSGSSGSPAAQAPDSPVSTAIVVQDAGFQDAASASALSATTGFPIFLTPQTSLGPDASQGLANDGIRQVILLGGPLAVSDSVASAIEGQGIAVLRIAGEDYTDTSQMLAQFELNSTNASGQTVGLDWDTGFIKVARGDFFSDSITAGPLFRGQPEVLTLDTNDTGSYLPTFLKQIGQTGYDPASDVNAATGKPFTINNANIIGGPLAITSSLENTVATALNG